jgi:hypothetical protein
MSRIRNTGPVFGNDLFRIWIRPLPDLHLAEEVPGYLPVLDAVKDDATEGADLDTSGSRLSILLKR